MIRVLFIVPYPRLKQLVSSVYQHQFENRDFMIDIKVLRAEEIKKISSFLLYDIIIGRGLSASLVKTKAPSLPIIEIPVTGYDIGRAILQAKKTYHSRKVAVFITAAVKHDAQVLREMLGIQIDFFIDPDVDSVPVDVMNAIAAGYDTIIGGYSATKFARAEGTNTVTVQTGEEAVIQVFSEVCRVAESIEQERKVSKIYQTIIQTSSEGILYVENSGKITVANRKILQMLKPKDGFVQGNLIQNVYPFFVSAWRETIDTTGTVCNRLMNIENYQYSVEFAPVVVSDKVTGVVITCQTASKIQQLESQIRKKLVQNGLFARYTFRDLIYKSPLMAETIQLAKKYAAVPSNILIVGETGTGKELMAQSIHNASERAGGPFVAVNCAALPENLLESELFGYTEGSFTGSSRGGKIGLFELAHKGTIFLDEISELPVNFQGKLLRVLQEHQIRRIGDDKVVDIDVRVIAATNRNLQKLVAEGKFRQDLLFRLDILQLYIPPLRDRREDIFPIFDSFIKKYNNCFGRDIHGCSEEAKAELCAYPFVGNIRELRTIAERISVMAEKPLIGGDLMSEVLNPENVPDSGPAGEKERAVTTQGIKTEKETELILSALRQAGGKKNQAAKLLGMDRTTLWRKMKEYSLI